MSSVNIFVTFNPLKPKDGTVSQPKLTLKSQDVEIIFTFKDSPGMRFYGFSSNDDKRQFTTKITDSEITVTDLDTLAEHVEYSLTLRDAAGKIFVMDPQIINNPKGKTKDETVSA